MTLRLVEPEEPAAGEGDPARTLAEVTAVAKELRAFVAAYRGGAMVHLTKADLVEAKTLLAEARRRLAEAHRLIARERAGRRPA